MGTPRLPQARIYRRAVGGALLAWLGLMARRGRAWLTPRALPLAITGIATLMILWAVSLIAGQARVAANIPTPIRLIYVSAADPMPAALPSVDAMRCYR